MILSVSRRTDVPNYYAEWFVNRVREGFLYVRNPMNTRQVSRISLSPEVVDCIVFWTKNPANLLPHLDALSAYMYYFQFTLTPYGRDLEPGLPDKKTVLIPTFQALSKEIGHERVIWRYDPILFTPKYTAEYHLHAFSEIARRLSGYTDRVVISFVDYYAKMRKSAAEMGLLEPGEDRLRRLAEELVKIAREYGMTVETCAEQMDLSDIGIEHGACIDKRRIEKLLGCTLAGGKDKGQRPACGCMESVEVGAYNTCKNGCRYCYANFSEGEVVRRAARYDPTSPMLCDTPKPEDKITKRKMRSLKR